MLAEIRAPRAILDICWFCYEGYKILKKKKKSYSLQSVHILAAVGMLVL